MSEPIFGVANDFRPEMQRQIGHISSTTKSISKILKSPKVQVPKKIAVIESHILSGGMYNCSTWSDIPESMYTKLFHCVIRPFRNATGNTYSKEGTGRMFSDIEIIQARQITTPMNYIRAHRLSLFSRTI